MINANDSVILAVAGGFDKEVTVDIESNQYRSCAPRESTLKNYLDQENIIPGSSSRKLNEFIINWSGIKYTLPKLITN